MGIAVKEGDRVAQLVLERVIIHILEGVSTTLLIRLIRYTLPRLSRLRSWKKASGAREDLGALDKGLEIEGNESFQRGQSDRHQP